jgi:outer membrane scaffolding protein for murein synthesis (MipA/OmpV family)
MTWTLVPARAAPFLIAAVMSSPALAGDGGYAPDSEFSLAVGGIVVVTPKYEGSADYKVIGAPYLAPSFGGSEGRVQFKGPDDVRFRLFEINGFEAGPLAGYRFGREEDDAARLWGLGDVDGGLVVGGYLAYRLGILKPFVSYHHQVTGDDGGGVMRFGTDAIWSMAPGVQITGTIGATWADDDYMATYFSVTPAQAAASAAGLPTYFAEAGIKDMFVGASAKIELTEAWTLNVMGRYTHLTGDAADSPIVETESQWTGGLGLSYRFNFR